MKFCNPLHVSLTGDEFEAILPSVNGFWNILELEVHHGDLDMRSMGLREGRGGEGRRGEG